MSEPSPKDLTKLMLFFGRIPEPIVKAMQSFPFIFFNDLKEAKLDYSVATKKEEGSTLFKYDLSLPLESNESMDKRCKALEQAIRSQFWADAKVKITVNEKEVYKSE